MKKLLMVLGIVLGAQVTMAGGNDVGSSQGPFGFPFPSNKQKAQGYMLITGTQLCTIIEGDSLFAGNKLLKRSPLDLTSALIVNDSIGHLGLQMTLKSKDGKVTQNLGLLGEMVMARGDMFKYTYQAPDTYHDFNHVEYVITNIGSKTVKVDITMSTAAGEKGDAQIECPVQN